MADSDCEAMETDEEKRAEGDTGDCNGEMEVQEGTISQTASDGRCSEREVIAEQGGEEGRGEEPPDNLDSSQSYPLKEPPDPPLGSEGVEETADISNAEGSESDTDSDSDTASKPSNICETFFSLGRWVCVYCLHHITVATGWYCVGFSAPPTSQTQRLEFQRHCQIP